MITGDWISRRVDTEQDLNIYFQVDIKLTSVKSHLDRTGTFTLDAILKRLLGNVDQGILLKSLIINLFNQTLIRILCPQVS